MDTLPYLPEPDAAALVILENKEVRCHSLEKKSRWKLGRITPDNVPDITLTSPIAGRKHGEFVFIGEQWFFCDGGSRNGTFHNGKKIESGLNGRVKPVILQNGDILRIDYSNLDTPDLRGVWILFTTVKISGEWKHIFLSEYSILTIGRSEECDIVQPLPYISACHAKIMWENGFYYILDCNSNAGTWLNGKKIQNLTALKEKDWISICDCHFIFTGGGILYNKRKSIHKDTDNNNLILYADIKSKRVSKQRGRGYKELLRDIRIELYRGHLVALLGSSGAGKSTLINCLNGTEQSGVDGTVMFQGENLYQNFERIKYLIGNVPQKNILHEILTVEEELKNAALLRLPGDIKREELEKQINDTLSILNLSEKRNTQIMKLSGGEKKRVNIGVELVGDRSFLCLDEPEAGLDPGAKKELFMILKKLVKDKGKSILAVIHDVAEIDIFDRIIMIRKIDGVGRVVYMGTPNHAKEYFRVDKLEDIYEGIDRADK